MNKTYEEIGLEKKGKNMDCPFCIPKTIKMKGGRASTDELLDARHLTCKSCGFSMTARNHNLLELAHDTLWNWLPDEEAE